MSEIIVPIAGGTNGIVAGLPEIAGDRALRLLLGTAHHEVCNAASGNAVPSMTNCRFIYVDVAGIIKIDFTDDHDGTTETEVLYLPAGVPFHRRNVTKVYRYYTGTTSCTAQVYDDTGAAVVGLKLER
jgi:hypothetical protein